MSLQLIGFYPTHDQAEHARNDLVNAGFESVQLYHAEDAEEARNAVARKMALEAARRHATALLLDADENVSSQALSILRRHRPVSMARANWPAHAWKEPAQPQRRETPFAQPAPANEASSPVPPSTVEASQQDEPQKAPSPFAEAAKKDEAEAIFSAKRFVSEIAGDERFRGRDWHEIEPFVQKEFAREYPNESWDDHAPAIMLGYTRAIEGR